MRRLLDNASICAKPMASSAHTITSVSRATVPISLRTWMGIGQGVAIAGRGCPLYGPAGMTAASDSHARIICLWLWAVAALVGALVLVGGATRLTESGLSIVEWRPVTGVLPPLTDAAWQSEFAKY